jgi:hypothetical protein
MRPYLLWLKEQKENHMRQLNKFGSYRFGTRGFFNEAKFLKFAEPRNQDNLTGLIRTPPNVFANEAIVTSMEAAELTRPLALAKKASS